jgi:hypothetical protein
MENDVAWLFADCPEAPAQLTLGTFFAASGCRWPFVSG